MIRETPASSFLELAAAVYPRESLEAAALAVSGRAEVYLTKKGRLSRVELRFARGLGAAGRRRAAGDFLAEALGHAYRQRVIRFHGPVTALVLVPLLERRFPQPRPDPLEAMEPQVAADRAAETAALLEKARRLA